MPVLEERNGLYFLSILLNHEGRDLKITIVVDDSGPILEIVDKSCTHVNEETGEEFSLTFAPLFSKM